jgi:lauroyl/myristoyl acyltransferase
VKPRHVLTWKFLFYGGFLPILRRLGPKRADTVLAWLGKLSVVLWPPRRKSLTQALARARNAVQGPWNPDDLALDLGAGALRFLARDYLLDACDDTDALSRFDVEGDQDLLQALKSGRGALLVGSHLGGHVATFQWLYRSGLAFRLMVQRPRHVSSSLNTFFDRDDPGAAPQSEFFLHRNLSRVDCVNRFLNARYALLEGKSLYLAGDVPWIGKNTRAGAVLGQSLRVLSVWVDLAVLTRTPVFFVFCTHGKDGRHALAIEPIGTIPPGSEDEAVARYFTRLEAAIAAHPADAVAHLLWPCYGAPGPRSSPSRMDRPSRRVAAVHS